MVGPSEKETFYLSDKERFYLSDKMPKIEPPTFISETKSFETYKKDLERWALLTNVKPELQALLVVHYQDGDASGVKGKIDAGIDEEELKTTEGIKSLLNFLATIYKVDALADSFEKYMQFEQLQRKPGVAIQEFISEWEMTYRKTKTTGCELADMVLAFKLLDAANLCYREEPCPDRSRLRRR